MTSALQQSRIGDEQPARCFIGFPFRLQADPRHVRRLDHQVMCQHDEHGPAGTEAGAQLVGFLHLGRSRVVRRDVSFDGPDSNDTQVIASVHAHACVTGSTGAR